MSLRWYKVFWCVESSWGQPALESEITGRPGRSSSSGLWQVWSDRWVKVSHTSCVKTCRWVQACVRTSPVFSDVFSRLHLLVSSSVSDGARQQFSHQMQKNFSLCVGFMLQTEFLPPPADVEGKLVFKSQKKFSLFLKYLRSFAHKPKPCGLKQKARTLFVVGQNRTPTIWCRKERNRIKQTTCGGDAADTTQLRVTVGGGQD